MFCQPLQSACAEMRVVLSAKSTMKCEIVMSIPRHVLNKIRFVVGWITTTVDQILQSSCYSSWSKPAPTLPGCFRKLGSPFHQRSPRSPISRNTSSLQSSSYWIPKWNLGYVLDLFICGPSHGWYYNVLYINIYYVTKFYISNVNN